MGRRRRPNAQKLVNASTERSLNIVKTYRESQSPERPSRSSPKDFEPLRDIIDRSSVMRLLRQHDRIQAYAELWSDAVGAAAARLSRVTRYDGGKLFVEVLSAPLLQELSGFRKRELIGKLQQSDQLRGLVDIVFRSG